MTSRRWQRTLVVVGATAAALLWRPPAMAQQPTESDLPLVAFLAPLSGEWGGVGRRAHRSVALAWRRGTSMETAFRMIADHVQRAARRILERELG